MWAETSSFSWFKPVYYQGSPDAPIVLRKDIPVAPKAVARGAPGIVSLLGTGFRTDTVVTLFKDGVTTATASRVKLTSYSLEFTVPAAFTNSIGVLTIQAKNPQATVGDAAAISVIATPVLGGLSPSSVDVTQQDPGAPYVFDAFTVRVTASDLPDDISLCIARVSKATGGGLATGFDSVISVSPSGFSFPIGSIPFDGKWDVHLRCGGVTSNGLSINFINTGPVK